MNVDAPSASSDAEAAAGTSTAGATWPATVWKSAAAFFVGLLSAYFLGPQLVAAAANWPLAASPKWPWFVVLCAASVATHVAGAVTLTGSTIRPLGFMTNVEVQFAVSFTNRLAPAGLGGMATVARYLRRRGADPGEVTAALALQSAAGFIIHAVATTAVLAAVSPQLLTRWRPPAYMLAIGAAVIAAALTAALAVANSQGRHWISAGVAGLREVLADRRRAVLLFAGAMGVTGFYSLALTASFYAFHVHIAVLSALAVFLAASVIAAGSPTPGGLGAAEAALVSAAAALVGQAPRVLEAVLAYRLVTYWIPSIPGVAALAHLRRRHIL